jgi:hypothetical protein
MNAQWLERVDHVAEMINEQCERRKFWLLSGFSIVYWVSTCWLASRKLMWNDELFTFYISRLPSLSDIWFALSTGADQIPPFFHITTRASFALFGVNHVSVRLPAIIGFWMMCLCLFQFVSKRSTALYGFAALLFPLVTNAYYFAYEARPYGLVLGFSGLSLLCWQTAAEGNNRKWSLLGLAGSLAGAVSSHYYAVLLLIPLAVGEMVRSRSRRRLDLSVWLAFGGAILPFLLFLPLIEAAKSYSAAFWAKPYWKSIPGFYQFLLVPAVLPLAATLVWPAVYAAIPTTYRGQNAQPILPLHELAAAFGLIGLPIIAVILAKLLTGAFTDRYALPAVIGVSILLAFAVRKSAGGRETFGVALVIITCIWFMVLEVRYFQRHQEASEEQEQSYQLLRSASGSDLPIVAADLHTFTRLGHYAPSDIASRIVYLADPRASLRYLDQTTVDQGILDLKPWFPLTIQEYNPYLASPRGFFVYGPLGRLNWLLYALTATNRQIELKGRYRDNLFFLVHGKK